MNWKVGKISIKNFIKIYWMIFQGNKYYCMIQILKKYSLTLSGPAIRKSRWCLRHVLWRSRPCWMRIWRFRVHANSHLRTIDQSRYATFHNLKLCTCKNRLLGGFEFLALVLFGPINMGLNLEDKPHEPLVWYSLNCSTIIYIGLLYLFINS